MNARPMTFALPALAAALFSACSGMPGMKASPAGQPSQSQAALPDAVKVPAGQKVALETVGVGAITYECREKPAAAGTYEWTFVGPKAVLKDRSGKAIGTYFGPPATWAANDGSKVSGAQQAVAPAGPGNLPLQLVKANAALGQGAMTGVSYIQRVATRGGVAPALPCDGAALGRQQVVDYQADYIFWAQQ